MNDHVKIGAVLQQHYNNPKQLGFDILKCVINIDLDDLDYIIFDIRDISGRLFIDIETEQGIPQKDFFPFFLSGMEIVRRKKGYDIFWDTMFT